ncbi:MAG: phosphate acyltransferase PlsX [Coriobacteriia bacterium]|nr:phosphate acyltransferase PlsX [Coriobacteriia bacterium]
MSEVSATVAVDLMGGDRAPDVVVAGVDAALAADPGLHVLLVGPEDALAAAAHLERCSPVIATEVIAMDEHPANAVRTKKDSSIVVGARLVREGSADGFFSAGNTGACMAAATLVVGRLRGVQRPALAAVIPAGDHPTVILDVGANADVKPEMLLQFAHMGAAYARITLGVASPRVGLLNIGEEPTKGSALAQEAYVLLTQGLPGFVGNVEGRDVTSGAVDVIVTDGFTGNVTLKVLEGLSRHLLSEVKAALTSTPINKLAAAVVQPSLVALKERLDPDVYGGAPLLGVNGVCMIGHGSSSARAIASGVVTTATAVRGGLTTAIAAAITEQDTDAA